MPAHPAAAPAFMTRLGAVRATLRRCCVPLVVALATLASGSATGGAPPPRAKLAMYLPSSSITQTSSGWTLTKTGSRSADTVTWQITASPSSTGTKTLTVTGRVTLLNLGNTPAPIGNIVVNLDARQPNGSWTTVAANVATAAAGDAATTAKIIDPTSGDIDEDDDANPWMSIRTITEGPGSGTLSFTQGPSTPWSPSPKQSIAPWSTLDLRFTATFNNSVLNLADGKTVRAEVIVTSGNAGTLPRTVPNVDIDGNGAISTDEAHVRSKARRLGQKIIPVATPVSAPVAISDTAADITTTGTVTFSNPVFTLGATTGTVTANVDSGTSGGAITNCVKLNGSGVALQACSTVNVPASADPCAEPRAAGCGWKNGEIVSINQVGWGDAISDEGVLLSTNYNAVYASTGGLLVIGLAGSAGNSITFTDDSFVFDFLPATSAPTALSTDYEDPPVSPAGSFPGHVIALKLDVDYSDFGVLLGSAGILFGDLTLCGVAGVDGLSIREFLGVASTLLGGGSASISVATADAISNELSSAFMAGVPSAYAQAHIVNGACN